MTMKFMKRKADADQAMMDDAEKRRKLLDDQWSCEPQDSTAMQIEGVEVEVDIVTASHNGHHERSHTTRYERVEGDLMSALPGRRSFGGYNPAVERHYARYQTADHILLCAFSPASHHSERRGSTMAY